MNDAPDPDWPPPRVRELIADLIRSPRVWNYEHLMRNIDAVKRRCRDDEFTSFSRHELNWLAERVEQAQRIYARRKERYETAVGVSAAALVLFGGATFNALPDHWKHRVLPLFVPLAAMAVLFRHLRIENDLAANALGELRLALSAAATNATGTPYRKTRIDVTERSAQPREVAPEKKPEASSKRQAAAPKKGKR